MPMSCQQCGAKLPEEANYCLKCARRVQQRTPRSKVFALASAKGRVGVTTTAISLSACLAEGGWRTLLVDMSPNAEATTGLGLNLRLGDGPIEMDMLAVKQSIYELLV